MGCQGSLLDWMRPRLSIFAAMLVAGVVLLACMYLSATSDPKVRTFHYAPNNWPVAAAPLRVILLTDAHVSGLDTPPARLSRVVNQINRLRPDLVLLGGDFISAEKLPTKDFPVEEAISPLRALRARLGVVAVMGNHDHWVDPAAVHTELARVGVTVLDNSAVRKGVFVVGGVDDAYTHHDDMGAVVQAMDRLGGVPILLSHSPDIFPKTPERIGLVLAGHTHCGQIAAPFIGPLITMSRYGRRFACGIIKKGSQRLIVSAGMGTSILPLRLNAPPDVWVIELGPGPHR